MGLGAYGKMLPPYVSLTTNSSIYGIEPQYPDKIGIGVIDSVNAYNYLNYAGDNCIFKKTDAVLVTAYGTKYWIIDETNLLFKEVLPH
jgi:hypothetical protein